MNESQSDAADVKLNVNRLGVVIAVLAGLAGLASAWFVLPYRMQAAEAKLENFESRVDRRFEATEAYGRANREILIRVDENVKLMNEKLKQLQETQRRP